MSSFFSAKPLRVSVGADGDCTLLGTDPTGLRGRPYDTTQAMTTTSRRFRPFSPNCVRWIAIPSLNLNPDGTIFTFRALDALGQWWAAIPGLATIIRSAEPGSDSRGWFEKAVDDVANAVIEYGIPILASALATTGVGAVGAVALLAWRNVAMGQSLTSAILNAQQTKLATASPSALDAFQYGLVKAEAGLTDAALKAAASTFRSEGGATPPAQAFYQAVQLVRSKQVQDLTVAALGTRLTAAEMSHMGVALRFGAPLADIVTGLRGKAGDALLAGIATKASAFVAANTANPARISAAISSPNTAGLVSSSPILLVARPAASSGGSSSGSSSGPGIGSFVVLGAAGFALYKFGPRIAKLT